MPMNSIGWILVAVGAAGLLTSVAGIRYIFFQPTPSSVLASSATALYLHDTYYVISRPLHSILPLLLCSALSAAISIVGYMHTDQFVRRMIQMEGDAPSWQSPPNDG